MANKYAALTRYLQTYPPDEEVSFDVPTLSDLVGGLPPSAAGATWWANTVGHPQAMAWLITGRIVRREAERIIFSRADGAGSSLRRGRATAPQAVILDGVTALADILRRAGYPSVVAAVAEQTVFLDPRTVAQTHNQPVFPAIRDMLKRGTFAKLPDNRTVLLDDNTTPTWTFLWAAGRKKGPDVQYNHVWTDARNPALYTALWNLCATPAFLAKTTDGQNHPEVRAALQYRAYELYGAHASDQPPTRPAGFDQLRWVPMPEPVSDLEATFRARLAAAPKSRPAQAARIIGWLYSDWRPDSSIGEATGPNIGTDE